MSELRDIFGNEVREGDKIAAGMSYGQSSVLRVGTVVGIKESTNTNYYTKKDSTKWSIRVRWTHNGHGSTYDVKESTIQIHSNYSYAKIVKLPPEYVEQFPVDNLKDGEQ